MAEIKDIIKTKWFIRLLYRLIRLYSGTFRFKVENEKKWLDLYKSGETVILCCWHQQFFSAIRFFKKYGKFKPCLMISTSSDGSMIAGVANLTGWTTPRGSSARGGSAALKEMTSLIKSSRFGAHIMDGPTGPAGKVKPGGLRMAELTGALIIPFYTWSDNAWYAKSWDRFMLPKPFSNVTLRYGDPIPFEEGVPFGEQIKKIEETMTPYLIH